MTAAAHSSESPVPDLPPEATPSAIQAALVERDRAQFIAEYQAALAGAATTLDLTPVLNVLRTYHHIAELTRQAGPAAWQRMLTTVDEIERTGTSSTAVSRAKMDELLQRRLGGQAQ